MRISDWSSDVCSSDLAERHHRLDAGHTRQALMDLDQRIPPDEVARKPQLMDDLLQPKLLGLVDDDEQHLVVQLRDRMLCGKDLVEGEIIAVRERRGTVGHSLALHG